MRLVMMLCFVVFAMYTFGQTQTVLFVCEHGSAKVLQRQLTSREWPKKKGYLKNWEMARISRPGMFHRSKLDIRRQETLYWIILNG